MTDRLYYADSYLTEFTATTLSQERRGENVAVVLDRTAFYPLSGGQPSDTGTLDSARVVDVEESASGDIVHITTTELRSAVVRGRIDWSRRFDHMQQHSGQHILSQAFLKTAGAGTSSFHLGRETSTIDIEIVHPSAEQVRAAESLASQIVFEDRPVSVLNVRPHDLAELGVRKESQREGEIRVIDVDGFDRSPCGGTHVRRSGEIGLIAILGWEHYKGMTRVEFVCGGRALRILRESRDIIGRLSSSFSSSPPDLPRLAERLLAERSQLQRENTRLQRQILEFEALEMLANADKSDRPIIVCRKFDERDLESLKILARRLVSCEGVVAVLSTTQDPAQIVVAKSPDVPGDCGLAVRQTAAVRGGKGGGRPDMAQAGGISSRNLDTWFEELVERFRSVTG